MRNRIRNILKTFSCCYLSLVTVIGLITIVAFSGSGCGNGDNNVEEVAIVLETGYFVDGPVEGLRYTTATQSGETDADGAFQYLEGEIVSFYVGDILIGQVSGSTQISPFDLAGIAPPETGIEVNSTINQLKNSNGAIPFEVAVNIAVFLQSLDDDGDLLNGIQIPAQMHTLAEGLSIDFEQKLLDFPSDRQLNSLMSAGRSAGLWEGSKTIRYSVYALNTMYAGLGITPGIYAPTIIEEDRDGDGIVDYRTTYTYDIYGNKAISEIDYGADGTVNYRLAITHEYDTNGNLTKYEYEYGSYADGTADVRNTLTFDSNGNLAIEEYDLSADGTVDERKIYTYDNNNNKTMMESDNGVDGTVDYRYIYDYDSNCNLMMEEYDYDADGTVNSRYIYTYDSNGNQTMLEYDRGADGTVDDRYAYAYDSVGNLTMEEADFGQYSKVIDEKHDYRYTYAYDSNGNLTIYEYDEYDDVGREIYTYDSNGNRTMAEYDSGADGSVDSRSTYAYDSKGNKTMAEYDYTADGTVDKRYTYTYDSNDNRTMEERDFNGDGKVDERYTNTYQVVGGWAYLIESIMLNQLL